MEHHVESFNFSDKKSPKTKKMISVLETRYADEQYQILNEKVNDQEIKIREYETKIAQLTEEKYQLKENLQEINICCEDLHKEKSELLETFKKAVEGKNQFLKAKSKEFESFDIRSSEDVSPSPEIVSIRKLPIVNKPMKLSKWLALFQNKHSKSRYSDEISISSYS